MTCPGQRGLWKNEGRARRDETWMRVGRAWWRGRGRRSRVPRGMTRKHLRVNTNKTRINEREKVQLITRVEDFKAIDAFVSWIWPQRRQISCWKWKKANPGKMWEARRRICSRATPSIP